MGTNCRDVVSVMNVSVSRRSRDVFWNISVSSRSCELNVLWRIPGELCEGSNFASFLSPACRRLHTATLIPRCMRYIVHLNALWYCADVAYQDCLRPSTATNAANAVTNSVSIASLISLHSCVAVINLSQRAAYTYTAYTYTQPTYFCDVIGYRMHSAVLTTVVTVY